LLSLAQRTQYERDGIVFPIPVLTKTEVERFRAGCDELEAQLGGNPRTVEVRQMHLHFRWAYELAVHPNVLDAVESVLGPNLLVWATELFAKRPRDSAVSIGWHRDKPYMGFDSHETTTAWIALGPSNAANGCMKVVLDADRQRAQTGKKVQVSPEQMTDVVLQPGEMSLHDPFILHGSGPNHSNAKRVGFAVRFISPSARPLTGRPTVILARGHMDHDYFEISSPPEDASPEVALGGMRSSAARHLEAMLNNLTRVGSS
jgi:ectoine hydroxylase-related dioxygenase (phytanoyl-CoA dioxygenase family)